MSTERPGRRAPSRRGKKPPQFDPGSFVKEEAWSVIVQRVGDWAVGYVSHAWRFTWSWVVVEPWDAWQSMTIAERRASLVSYLKRVVAGNGVPKASAAEDTSFKSQFPAVYEYLTSTVYPDGSVRRTSSISVFVEDGLWKAALNDRDQDLVLFVAESSFQALLEALELLLQEDQVPWRKSKRPPPRPPRNAKDRA